jgi:hypothetical protein
MGLPHLGGQHVSTFNGYNCSLLATCFHAGFLFGLFSNPEDEGDIFLQNVD